MRDTICWILKTRCPILDFYQILDDLILNNPERFLSQRGPVPGLNDSPEALSLSPLSFSLWPVCLFI